MKITYSVYHDTQVTIQYVNRGLSWSIQSMYMYVVSLHLYKLARPWHFVINMFHCTFFILKLYIYFDYKFKFINLIIFNKLKLQFINMYQHCHWCVKYFQMVEILQLWNRLFMTLTGALQHWRFQWIWKINISI